MKLFISAIFFIFISQSIYSQINTPVYIDKARREIMNNENAKAIERLNTVIKMKPGLYDAYFYRGIAKFGLGDYTGAVGDFTETIRINPFFPLAYQYRGIAKDALHNYNSALNDFDKAISLDVNNSGLYSARALTKINIQNYSAAVEDLNKAIKLNSFIPEFYIYRAVAKSGLKQYKSAIVDCNKAIAINQFDAQAFVRRGLIYFQQEDYDKAIRDYNHALKIKPDAAYTYYVRALAKYKKEDIEGTLADYGKVIELNPYNALAYYNRAMLYAQKGETEKAITDLLKVSEINPAHILTHYNRGQMRFEQKQYQQAIEDFTTAIDIYPDFGEAYYMRSMAERKLGYMSKAKKDYRIAEQKMNQQNADTSKTAFNQAKYRKVIELEANFNNNFIGDGRIYSVFSGIDPLSDYLINVISSSSINYELIRNIDEYNKKLPHGLRLTTGRLDSVYTLQSVTALDSVWQNRKKNEFYFLVKGIIELSHKNFNLSIQAFNQALSINPDFAPAYFNRAYAQMKTIEFINSIDQEIHISVDQQQKNIGKKTEQSFDYRAIIDDYSKALSLQPDWAVIYFNRANIKTKAKDYNGALFDYQRALKLEPEFAEAYYNKALIHIYLQQMDLACADLSKAGELGLKKAYVVIKRYCAN